MKNFENAVFGLFDFQRFEKNSRLDRLIEETEARCALAELSDDELEWVNAAGEIHLQKGKIATDKADDDDD